jgi:hypothetical protein
MQAADKACGKSATPEFKVRVVVIVHFEGSTPTPPPK